MSMNYNLNKSAFAKVFELREDVIDNTVPHFEMTGNKQLMIEGCKGITEYTLVSIRINTGSFSIIVKGKNLYIKSYNSQSIIIEGFIEGLSFAF